jgi:hypothetical protein
VDSLSASPSPEQIPNRASFVFSPSPIER